MDISGGYFCLRLDCSEIEVFGVYLCHQLDSSEKEIFGGNLCRGVDQILLAIGREPLEARSFGRHSRGALVAYPGGTPFTCLEVQGVVSRHESFTSLIACSLGNNIGKACHCLDAAGEISRRQHDFPVILSDQLDEGLGHSFRYFPPGLPRLFSSSSTSEVDGSFATTTFRSISGASVRANTSTPLSTSLPDLCSSSVIDRASSFASPTSFASSPLQPLPRCSIAGYAPLTTKTFVSGPVEEVCGKLQNGCPIYKARTESEKPRFVNIFRKLIFHMKSIAAVLVKADNNVKKPNSKKKNGNVTVRRGDNLYSKRGDAYDQESQYSMEKEKLQWAERKAGEDRVQVVISEEHGWVFVGIYDGFNGPDATEYLLSILYSNVHNELKDLVWNAKFEPTSILSNSIEEDDQTQTRNMMKFGKYSIIGKKAKLKPIITEHLLENHLAVTEDLPAVTCTFSACSPSSLNKDSSHTVSEAAFARDRYSASVDDHATALCFFELQEIGFEPRKLMYAEVDVRSSKLPAQSALEDGMIDEGDFIREGFDSVQVLLNRLASLLDQGFGDGNEWSDGGSCGCQNGTEDKLVLSDPVSSLVSGSGGIMKIRAGLVTAMRGISVEEGGVVIGLWLFSNWGIEFSVEDGSPDTMMKFGKYSIIGKKAKLKPIITEHLLENHLAVTEDLPANIDEENDMLRNADMDLDPYSNRNDQVKNSKDMREGLGMKWKGKSQRSWSSCECDVERSVEPERKLLTRQLSHLEADRPMGSDIHSEVLRALSEALRKTEDAYLEIADDNVEKSPELALMGSCVLVMLMKNEDVYLMNVGDSRAVLAQEAELDDLGPRKMHLDVKQIREDTSRNHKKNNGFGWGVLPNLIPLQLTTDHSTYVEEEVHRIRTDHPDDASAIENDRVKGYLKVTRAFGVGFLKQPKWNDALLEMFRIEYVGTSPYITCLPSLYHYKLGPRDRFLILSSDGLYQYLSNEEAVSQVEYFINKYPKGDPAQYLIEQVLFQAAQKHDMELDELLDIPQGERRRYHDDVSIVVIYLEGRIWRSYI
ncbi:probable protein phosphatase 2C 23 [Juglans regia]|uniref:Probable protein phosphatase 2C 23 n=1 Tax=Juglans regia TaxID=51240 RepID=A0A6P9EKY0_JUGRE|nr:probable protein phosphatase 2C 23 [Juglans regia]